MFTPLQLYLPERTTEISSLEYKLPKQDEISKAPPKGTMELEFATNRSPVEVTAISAGGGVLLKSILPIPPGNWVKESRHLQILETPHTINVP